LNTTPEKALPLGKKKKKLLFEGGKEGEGETLLSQEKRGGVGQIFHCEKKRKKTDGKRGGKKRHGHTHSRGERKKRTRKGFPFTGKRKTVEGGNPLLTGKKRRALLFRIQEGKGPVTLPFSQEKEGRETTEGGSASCCGGKGEREGGGKQRAQLFCPLRGGEERGFQTLGRGGKYINPSKPKKEKERPSVYSTFLWGGGGKRKIVELLQ